MIQTLDQKRAKIRAELTKELLGSPTEKRDDKSKVAIHTGASKKAKFLANPNNRIDPKIDSIQKMNACPNPKYRKEKRQSAISVAKVLGEKE